MCKIFMYASATGFDTIIMIRSGWWLDNRSIGGVSYTWIRREYCKYAARSLTDDIIEYDTTYVTRKRQDAISDIHVLVPAPSTLFAQIRRRRRLVNCGSGDRSNVVDLSRKFNSKYHRNKKRKKKNGKELSARYTNVGFIIGSISEKKKSDHNQSYFCSLWDVLRFLISKHIRHNIVLKRNPGWKTFRSNWSIKRRYIKANPFGHW